MTIRALVPTLLLGAALALPASALAQFPGVHICKVIEVATFSNRVHVQCQDAAAGDIRFFAAPTSSSSEATRLVTLGSAALAGAGDLVVGFPFFDPNTESFGCAVENCRRPFSIQLK